MKKLMLESFLPYRLNRLSAAMSREFRTVYGHHHDLTVPEWRVLATLGEYDQMSAKAIGAHSAMHKTKVSRAVKALEDRRWLRREEHPKDRREEVLFLTPLGRSAYADIVPKAIAFEGRMLESLGVDGEIILHALQRLEEKLSVDTVAT